MEEFRLFIITLFPRDIVSNTSSVTESFEAISRHQLWDYSSYCPIEEISMRFGGDDPQLSEWIKKYKSELAGFKATTKIADYIKVCSGEEAMADSEERLQMTRYDKHFYRRLTFKLKTRVTEESLDYIDELWRSIAKYFYLPSLSVILDTIKEGCVEVTWLVPTPSALQIQTNIQDSEEFLQAHHVMHVMLDCEVLDDQEEGLDQV